MKNTVFLIGAARSGTKFIRDLLGESPEVCTIPYDINYVWRTGNESCDHDELGVELLDERLADRIRESVVKISGISETNENILLEKTVGNTLRVAYVQSIFPDAKFIHLVRDGRAVTESAMRLWKSPPKTNYLLGKLKYFPWSNYRYAVKYIARILAGLMSFDRGQSLWGPLYKGVQDDVRDSDLLYICARQWQESINKATVDLALLPEKNVFTLKYEELMSSDHVLKELCEFVGISDPQIVLSAYHIKKNDTNIDKWQTVFDDVQLNRLNEILNSELADYEYM